METFFTVYELKVLRQALLVDYLSDPQPKDEYKKELLDKLDRLILEFNQA